MKTLEQLTKKQLIKLITEIRPKADAYDRVCQELGIGNNVIGEFKKLNIPPVIISVCGSQSVGSWCIGCYEKKGCELYNKPQTEL